MADAYDRYVGRYSPLLARELTAIAGVVTGQLAVNVGCGTGALTAQLVGILGADSVAAADPSEPFVSVCRDRNPGVRVEIAPAEALPFGGAEFDHALSQLVVNFLADAHAGLAEMRRVTQSGGTISAATWDYAEGMTLIRTFFDAAIALNPAAAEHDEGRSMRYCQPDELRDLWLESGLLDVGVQPVIVRAGYAHFDDLWQPLEHGVGPAGAYVVSLDAQHRQALRDELRRRLGVGDQPFELPARAWVAKGRVPLFERMLGYTRHSNSRASIGTRVIGQGPQRARVSGLEARADPQRKCTTRERSVNRSGRRPLARRD